MASPLAGSRVEPIINGHRYSYASIEISANGLLFAGVTRISYGASLTPGSVYATDPQRKGRTPGTCENRCELVMYRREFNALIASLGPSFGRRTFEIVVQYAENGDEGVTTDALHDCRITDVDLTNEDGTEASAVTLTIDPFTVTLTNAGLAIDDYNPNEPAVDGA